MALDDGGASANALIAAAGSDVAVSAFFGSVYEAVDAAQNALSSSLLTSCRGVADIVEIVIGRVIAAGAEAWSDDVI
eukprot:2854134-Prymnesium_polylepis.1